MLYYRTAFQSSEFQIDESSKNIFAGLTSSEKKEKEMITKANAKAHMNEQLYKYELQRYNKLLKEANEKYAKLIVIIQQNEESRIFFVKSTMDKYKTLFTEYNKIIEEYTKELSNLISSEVCENEIKQIKDGYNNKLVDDPEEKDKKIKFPKKEFVSFEDFAKNNKEKLSQEELNYEMIGDTTDENQTKLTDAELEDKIKNIINELIHEKDIENDKIGELINIMKKV